MNDGSHLSLRTILREDDQPLATAGALRPWALADASPDVIWSKTPDGIYVDCNRRLEELYGRPRAEILGRSVRDFWPRDDAEAVAAADRAVIETGTSQRTHTWVTFASDGHREYLETVRSVVRDDRGEIVGIFGVGRDQTALAESRRRLAESEEQLARAQALSRTGSWVADLATGDVVGSAEALRFMRCPPGTRLALADLTASVHPDDRERVVEAWSRLPRDGSYHLLHRVVLGGEVRWIRALAELERDESGRPARARGVFTDITDYKAIEDELERRERIYGLVAGSASLGIVLIDPRTDRIAEINDTACTVLGATRSELTARSIFELDVVTRTPGLRAQLEASKAQDTRAFEVAIRHEDGQTAELDVRIHRVGVHGVPFLAAVFWDVTERKRADAQLRMLSLVVEQSPAPVVVTDLAGSIEYVNEAFVRVTGYDRSELIGANPRILKSGETPDATYAAMWGALARGEPWRGELVNRCKDGSLVWETTVIFPMRQPDGRVTRYLGIEQDITELKRTQAELERHKRDLEGLVRQRTAELSAVFNALPDLYFRTDRRGVVLDFLSCETSQLHASPEEFLGRRLHDVMPPEVGDLLDAAIARIERGEPMVELVYGLGTYGLSRSFETRVVPLGAAQLVVVVRDVTERTRAAEALASARDAAEAANRAKTAFLANMSHEIRTPMNAIVGLAHLVQRETTNARHREQLAKITGAAHHLLGIVNDLLDLSKIEAGKVALESSDFDVCRIVTDVLDLVSEKLIAKGIDLVVDADELPPVLRGDGFRVRQILLNFAGNAVKFTERGTITIRGRVVARSDRDCRVRFEVTDTGIGLTEEQRARLFRPFEQADASITRRHGGTGLGLVIAKRLAQAMGGEVGCESALGEGSTFWFEVPLGVASTEHVRPSNP
ncbi:PAS domain S-box protein, partial [Myxococcota bacterium]|nr:PAS domain S-box protein [Myxococcota bacterium]